SESGSDEVVDVSGVDADDIARASKRCRYLEAGILISRPPSSPAIASGTVTVATGTGEGPRPVEARLLEREAALSSLGLVEHKLIMTSTLPLAYAHTRAKLMTKLIAICQSP
ncbi:unnamed protein product, partial [Protopolystoma xenopodis]